ncbi:hypothetical protein [Vibrio breoganii]|uniref:hypothetical protein n=1 Tax=Vibrio breoganii TaxID=553239 RepID=UPI000C86525C|nr:hypothetical protein [Vibrio breoganii]PMH18202.1 hypothetical protein BCU74_09530 [Vibrio breoganii]PMM17595.1 hypothetical protein BCT60_03675 [Vibrio breoganii]
MKDDIFELLAKADEDSEAELNSINTSGTNKVINAIMKIEKDFIYGNSTKRRPDIKNIILKNHKLIVEESC